MKKLLATIVLLTYFAVSSGFVVCLHYCMDRIDSVELGGTSSDKCGKCGMHKDGGCCKDEVMVIKLETSHLPSPVIAPDFTIATFNQVPTGFLLAPVRNYISKKQTIAHSPPLSEKDSYLSNCVFRI
jgi:hypothetical protein